MRYSALFPTRRCPRNCVYCGAKKVQSQEMSIDDWIRATYHLYDFGVVFHTFLGNELLMLGDNLIKLYQSLQGRQDYAVYSSFPEPLYSQYRQKIVNAKAYNVSAGIDLLDNSHGSIGEKSLSGLSALKWFKEQGIPDVHGTITLHKASLPYAIQIADILSSHGIAMAFNTIHWNIDGQYDFFADKRQIEELLFTKDDLPNMKRVAKVLEEGIKTGKYNAINPPEYFDAWLDGGYMLQGGCTKPYLLGVDSDGSLRLCGYRKGNIFPKYSVFDLGTKISKDDYLEIWTEERRNCKNCFWIYYIVAEMTGDIYGRTAADDVLRYHNNKPYLSI